MACSSDGACLALNGTHFVCNDGTCAFKALFPLSHDDVVSSLLAIVAVFLASGGGIGGGGLLVPLFVYTISTSYAIPLSIVTIFGGQIANMAWNIKKKHPLLKTRPLIDWNLALVLEPTTLAGTIFGVLMHTIFPVWLVTILLVLMLGFSTYKTTKKGMKLFRQESKAAAAVAVNESSGPGNIQVNTNSIQKPLLASNALERIMKKESAGIDRLSLSLLLLLWATILLTSMVKKAGPPFNAGVVCGSAEFWMVTLLPVPVALIVCFVIGRRLKAEHSAKTEAGYTFQSGDIMWNTYGVSVIPALSSGAGVCAGLLGIGGGMVQGPLMLELGVLPPVQRATSAAMVLFTCSSTAVQFLLAGSYPGPYGYDYAGWFLLMGFVGTLLGQLVMKKVLERTGRASFVVFALAGLIGLSAAMQTYTAVMTIIPDVKSGTNLSFKGLCSAK